MRAFATSSVKAAKLVQSPVPRRHQHYEGATTPTRRITGHLFVSLPVPTRFLQSSCSPCSALGRVEVPHRARIIGQPTIQLPACSHVGVSGTSQVPRRSVLCLCPVPRPRPDRRVLATSGRVRCCPCCWESKGSSVLIISRLPRGFGTCCLRFKSGVTTATCKTRFRLAGWPLPGGS